MHEIRISDRISYGAAAGPAFLTQVIELDSGDEYRMPRWDGARHNYDLSYAIKSNALLYELKTFYMARMGKAYGFRLLDWMDHSTASDGRSQPSATDELLGTGDGVEKNFQLVKRYSSGGVIRTRNLRKPVLGSTVVSLNGAQQGSGWSVNTTTGFTTFTVAPTLGTLVKGGCLYDVPVRFAIGDEVLSITQDDVATGNINSIPCIEMFEDDELSDEYDYGGSSEYDPMTASITLTPNNGRTIIVNPTIPDLKIKLPEDPSSLPSGGPFFFIKNISTTRSVGVKKHNGAHVVTLEEGEGCTIVKAASTWYAF